MKKWPYALFCLLLTVLMMPEKSYGDYDSYWHIALGKAMLEQGKIIKNAIGAFDESLPYIPHEAGFQIVAGWLDRWGGAPATYLLVAVCLGALIWGAVRLSETSREELGMKKKHPLALLFAILLCFAVYSHYFKVRPQIASAAAIVWFVVHMRELRMNPSWRKVFAMAGLSLFVANFHAGVWPVMPVFMLMDAIDGFLKKEISVKRAAAWALATAMGPLNPGGFETIFYLGTTREYNHYIAEWNPIAFGNFAYPLIGALLFAACAGKSLFSSPFRFMFGFGILFLGLANYKQHLFLLLFLPYYAAPAFGMLKIPERILDRISLSGKTAAAAICAGLAINAAFAFAVPAEPPSKKLPVEEMKFVAGDWGAGKPKVLAIYEASGYLMANGALVLADGRQDPFISPKTEGPHGWNAFLQAMFLTDGYLSEIIAYNKPDYVILPPAKNFESKPEKFAAYQKEIEQLGAPDFKGQYGAVWKISGKEKAK